MFFGGEDDDDSFLPSGGGSSKLASLFGSDKTRSARGNTSLTYTAPTEPKKKKQVESTESHEAANTAVLHAVAVTAYKLVEGNFTSQGKLGAAIIGNHSESSYKLLLYVSKQQQVTHVVINANFHFTIQPSNYANFYDSSHQNWSVLFESAKQLAEFARQIAITRANSVAGSLDTLIIQDLGLGDGEALEHGDSVEVKYTGWLWEEHGPGQVFDTNSNSEKLFRFRLGKGKVIKGWDEGLPGMKKGSSRLLIVPPSLAYGAEGISPKVPPGATLIFEVDVVRIKFAKEKESPQVSQTPPAARTDTESEVDGGVKARSKSISEQLEHHEAPKTDKARLISRMAKMGQPMLPGIVAAAPGQPDSDHETEESQTVASTSPCVSPKPVLAAKPVLSAYVHSSVTGAQPSMTAAPVGQPVQPAPTQHLHLHPEQVSQMALYQPLSLPQSHLTQPGYPPGALAGSVPYLPPTPMYAPQPYTGVSSEVNVMMSESRQQNTEVRLAVGSIADKIDRLTEKIDRLDKGSGNAVAMMGVLPNMETDVLLHNLQRIIQENDRLKKDLSERTTKAETQNDKISELLQRNQRLMEQNNTFLEKSSCTFEASATHSRAVIQAVEQEKAQLTAQLTAATAQVGALQTTVNSLKKHESELDQQVAAMHDTEQRRKKDLEDVMLKLTESEQTLEEIQRETGRDKQIHRQQDRQQHSLEEEFSEIKAVNDTLEKKLTDLKRKFAEEKKELGDEMDKLKTQHEVSQAKEWQEKCDQLVSSANKKHQRELDEWKAEKGQLEERVEALERKYANLRSRAGEMKEHYEEKLAQERETREGGADPQAVVAEVKKIMNSVYQNLRTKFVSDKSYAGADIHSTILHAIKTVTLQLVERQKMQDEEEEPSGEEDQDEGDEEGEVEGGSFKGELTETKEASMENVEAGVKISQQVYSENCDTGIREQTECLSQVACDSDDKLSHSDDNTHKLALTDEHMTDGVQKNDCSEHEGHTIEESAATAVVTASQGGEKGKQQGLEDRIEAMMSPETSQKPIKSKSLEDQIEAVMSHDVQGKKPLEDRIEAMMSHDVKKKLPLEDRIEAMMCEGSTEKKVDNTVEETVRAVAASMTGGGGGNPYYAAELEAAGKPQGVDVIQRVVAPFTGDRGNPHYAAELEAGKPHKDVQPVLAAQVTTQLAGKAPTKGKKKSKPVVSAKVASPPAGKAPEKDGIKAVVAQVTGGGGGNPHYAAELEKGGKGKSKDLHDVIKPVVAMATGDKGNPHYAAELAHSHQQENPGSGVGRSEVGKKPVKSEEKKDSSKRSGSKTATDKMDAVFAGIADAMEDTSKTSDKQSKKAASKEKQKQETILAATDALFSDPFFDASLPKTDATEGSKKHKGKSQSEKPVSGADDDLAARLGIITTATSRKTPSKSSTIKPSTRTTNSDDDLKPRPPPQPLFVDDDDDDLDWMK